MVLVILIFLYLYVSIELSIYCTKSSILFMAMKKHTSTFLELIGSSVHFRSYRYWKQNITQIQGGLLIILVDPPRPY